MLFKSNRDFDSTLFLLVLSVGFFFYLFILKGDPPFRKDSLAVGLLDLFQHAFSTLIGYFFGMRASNGGNGGGGNGGTHA